MNKLNVVIFSKDRPAQLDACLRSFQHFFQDKDKFDWQLKVIYRTSEEQFEEGYRFIEKCLGPKVGLVSENVMDQAGLSFKSVVREALDPEAPYTMFLVDDIIFKEPFQFFGPNVDLDSIFENQEVLAHSLRLGQNINFCYPTNQNVEIPEFITGTNDNILYWDWRSAQGDWGYPMSVDGHVFKTSFISKVIDYINFRNPNSFEGNMAQLVGQGRFHHMPLMSVPRGQSVLLNIPANRVQEEAQNRHGNLITAREMNEYFNSDKRIDIKPFFHYDNKSPHVELSFTMQTDQRKTKIYYDH